MAIVFVSYAHQSKEITAALVKDIESLGHSVWFDDELSGGQIWWDQILARVRGCDVFVFVLGPAALNSTACRSEYGYASDLGKTILPVLVADGVRTDLLPPALSQVQSVAYRTRDPEAALRLARAFTTLPTSGPLPDPLPPPPEPPPSNLGVLTFLTETHATTWRQRVLGGVVGTGVGAALATGAAGVLAISDEYSSSSPFVLVISWAAVVGAAGAIAGAICGTHSRVIAVALAGSVLGSAVFSLLPYSGDTINRLGWAAFVGLPVGAIVGAAVGTILKWRRRWT